jgi:hypothetical protein
MYVNGPGKPPKLRWKPGSFLRVRGKLYEIMYAYRVQDEPQEWRFSLEERKALSSAPTDALGQIFNALGAGSTTPRIVYEVFRDGYAAHQFFSDIPLNADRWEVGNKFLLQNGELVSSGEVLPKGVKP